MRLQKVRACLAGPSLPLCGIVCSFVAVQVEQHDDLEMLDDPMIQHEVHEASCLSSSVQRALLDAGMANAPSPLDSASFPRPTMHGGGTRQCVAGTGNGSTHMEHRCTRVISPAAVCFHARSNVCTGVLLSFGLVL